MTIKKLFLALLLVASSAFATEIPLGRVRGLTHPNIPFPDGATCATGQAIQTIGPGGTAISCIDVGSGLTIPGADTYVIYNNMNQLGADQYFTWNYNSQVLHMGIPGTPGLATFGGGTLAALTTAAPSDGTWAYCSDCAVSSNPCTASSTGSMAERVNGTWICPGVGSGSGSVTSVAQTVPGGFSISGSPITTTGTLAISANGTSGGVLYYSASNTSASSGELTAAKFVLGGGAGNPPTSSAAGDDGSKITTGARDLSYAQALYITGLRSISTSVAANASDRIVLCTSGSSTDKTYTLPAPTGSGRTIDVIKVDTGTNTCIVGTASGAINGGTIATLSFAWNAETCIDIGSGQWSCRGVGVVS